ncbi:formyltransferase family protein [Autumnicola musiva]|uniref:Formyltransferase family protein n=1 Tax=Autumnicola musiva TaxID=3075589 RepID=A0ABU3D386_9FLAO|nr:formyltransferase family protein [Zunongwangia sp. F117]MDT0675954.1 formyltransferase family protein [Zunongwangia sp. F117]
MNWALVGNNDGPLRILKSLGEPQNFPLLIGLQKPVSAGLQREYLKYIDKDHFFSGFEEDRLLQILENYKVNFIVNCFCNFRFIKLLEYYKVLNIHLSALPKYRGRHPLHWALINGEDKIGITIHEMTPGFDEGPICWQEMIKAEDKISVASARENLLTVLENNFSDFLINFKKAEIKNIKNLNEEATYIKRRIPADSRLVEWKNRDLVYRKVWALSSERNPAYIMINNKKIIVREAEKIALTGKFKEGSIIYFRKDSLEVSCEENKGIILKLAEDILDLNRHQSYKL